MYRNHHALKISGFKALPVKEGWKWHITFLYGGVVFSEEEYPTAETALEVGKTWIKTEAAFNALNQTLSELYGSQSITQKEYRNLMASFIKITDHR